MDPKRNLTELQERYTSGQIPLENYLESLLKIYHSSENLPLPIDKEWLDALAQLDNDYQTGAITEEVYHAEKKDIVDTIALEEWLQNGTGELPENLSEIAPMLHTPPKTPEDDIYEDDMDFQSILDEIEIGPLAKKTQKKNNIDEQLLREIFESVEIGPCAKEETSNVVSLHTPSSNTTPRSFNPFYGLIAIAASIMLVFAISTSPTSSTSPVASKSTTPDQQNIIRGNGGSETLRITDSQLEWQKEILAEEEREYYTSETSLTMVRRDLQELLSQYPQDQSDISLLLFQTEYLLARESYRQGKNETQQLRLLESTYSRLASLKESERKIAAEWFQAHPFEEEVESLFETKSLDMDTPKQERNELREIRTELTEAIQKNKERIGVLKGKMQTFSDNDPEFLKMQIIIRKTEARVQQKEQRLQKIDRELKNTEWNIRSRENNKTHSISGSPTDEKLKQIESRLSGENP